MRVGGWLVVVALVCLPVEVAWWMARTPQRLYQRMLPMLALTRAQRIPYAGTVAISGVVASLALAVALTVMVSSFRGSVTQWLDTVLPADMYLRASAPNSSTDTRAFNPQFVDQLRQQEGVKRASIQHTSLLTLDPNQPQVALIARDLQLDASGWPLDLPAAPAMANADRVVAPGANHYPVWISEALRDTYDLSVGQPFDQLLARTTHSSQPSNTSQHPYVAGIWRDYARQSGSIVVQWDDLANTHITPTISDIAITFASDQDATPAVLSGLQPHIRALYSSTHDNAPSTELNMATTGDIRAQSLRIFDRSFAVTQWLQLVAIGIGSVGVAASVRAQVLA